MLENKRCGILKVQNQNKKRKKIKHESPPLLFRASASHIMIQHVAAYKQIQRAINVARGEALLDAHALKFRLERKRVPYSRQCEQACEIVGLSSFFHSSVQCGSPSILLNNQSYNLSLKALYISTSSLKYCLLGSQISHWKPAECLTCN